ncbi:FlgD immunoglobulin-like domain containing protein [Candidatus Chrysopegis kryptomonas]|uniref:BNR/Asp-box repeat-containing protein n=1 Tax=Candidatus Chryseopegocella kryptomonas TaxID=1633643 RepID=A0A0N7MXC4_9BACT|nr:sialidase family protein [Candidatus Chrysopegis kryptomonas]CUT01051.1 BNR/Asp-box repeat-containing protein [Candidatus Chrysopegis kryptomonas]
MRIKLVVLIFCLLNFSFSQLKLSYEFNAQSLSNLPAGNIITNLCACGDTIWVGSSKGLSRTTDGGRTWKNYYQTPEFGTSKISAIACKNGVIWVATARTVKIDNNQFPEGLGLLYSTDGGETWTKIEQPIDTRTDTIEIYGINQLKTLPITTTINNITYDIAITKDAVFIASFAGGLRKSTDMGKTWQRVVLPPDFLNQISPDENLNFELDPVKNYNHRVFSVIAVDDSIIWVGTADGINKSIDGGKTWIKYNHQNQTSPISGNFVVALGNQKIKNGNEYKNIIWGATINANDPDEYKALSFSEDGGNTWRVTLIGEFVHNLDFRDSIVYAVSDNGLWRTTNFGQTWEKAGKIVDLSSHQSINTNIFYSIAVQGDTIWAGSADGLVKFSDSETFGSNWKIFRAYEKVSGTEKTYAYPNPFSPWNEVARIHYSVENPQSKVTIEIFDFGMRKIKTLIMNAPRTGKREYDEVWDGKDDEGNVVPNGVYFYRVKIDEKELYGKILVVQ